MFRGTFAKTLLFLVAATYVNAIPEPSGSHLPNGAWGDQDIINRDIVIIGGGASGTYAAVRLHDLNQSVIVVERTNRLGGHTETYTDPVTQAKIDIGVVVWHDTQLVHDFFARFDVPLLKVSEISATGVTNYVDYRTGKVVGGYVPGDPTAALGAYTHELLKYLYLEAGFDLPDPVPEDLLLPFGDFVTKYNISGAVKIIFDFNQGIGDLLKTSTLYVMKLFGLSIIQNIQSGFLTTTKHDNSEIYEKAEAMLSSAKALLLNSNVIAVDRDNGLVKMVVSTSCGFKLIKAKKILLTIPPTLLNVAPFNLDSTEFSLLKQFSATGYYSGLLRNAGIADNTSIVNIGADTLYNLPHLPGLYGLYSTGVPGLHQVLYGSPTALPVHKAKDDVMTEVQKLYSAGTVMTSTPEWEVFSSHTPFEFTVSADAIKDGFYKNLTALQGHRKMFYSGAAFHTHDSSMLWQFIEGLLPQIVA